MTPKEPEMSEAEKAMREDIVNRGGLDPAEPMISMKQTQKLLHKYCIPSSRASIERFVRQGKIRYFQLMERTERWFSEKDVIKIIHAAYMRDKYQAHKDLETPIPEDEE